MSADLISLPIPIDKTKLDSRFRLVILASERARVMLMGAKPVIHTSYRKETTIALQEICTAQVTFLMGKDARRELRRVKASRGTDGMKTASERAKEEAVKSELEKDLTIYLAESEIGEKTAESE